MINNETLSRGTWRLFERLAVHGSVNVAQTWIQEVQASEKVLKEKIQLRNPEKFDVHTLLLIKYKEIKHKNVKRENEIPILMFVVLQ